jgi:subtilisin family serine protease
VGQFGIGLSSIAPPGHRLLDRFVRNRLGVQLDPRELARLSALMNITAGRPELIIGLLDGPVDTHHPDLESPISTVSAKASAHCGDPVGPACHHGTFIAGVLGARRGSAAPAITPGCTLLLRPLFWDTEDPYKDPSASPSELALAIVECIDGGARLINVSAALTGGPFIGRDDLSEALRYAVSRQVLVVASAGNEATISGSVLATHPWVLPVMSYSTSGNPAAHCTLGRSLGIRGLGAPGDGVTSLSPGGGVAIRSGTSIAAAFVTGAAALLWSLVPEADAATIRAALLSAHHGRRRSVIAPLLDAWSAYASLTASRSKAGLR